MVITKKMKSKAAQKAKSFKKLKNKKKLSDTTTDEFLDQDFDVSDEEIAAPASQCDFENIESDDEDLDPVLFKQKLEKLNKIDPDFYKYLEENDEKLLNYDFSDDEGKSSVKADADDSEKEDEDEESFVPNENLEVASDESDYENDEETESNSSGKITQTLLKTWRDQIQTDKSAETIRCVIKAFHSAVVSLETSGEDQTPDYQVHGRVVFNGVVQLCVLYLPDALRRFLKVESVSKFDAHKSKRFIKIKGMIKTYLSDLVKILDNVMSPDILTVLLKHLHQMIPYSKSFSTLNKSLLRTLLRLWSSADDTVRVIAFLNILRIATSREKSLLENLFKTMYMKYVENAKFVSPNSAPGINFMKHSLVEIYMLDQNLAYNHAFLYIRQLAIHLRNAITLKKKENFQTVYNWQFVNSLRLWTELIAVSSSQSMLRSLLYPLVQIITGTIKLIPTATYYPLRFHCVQMLIRISKETGVFIPVLPFVLEVLRSYNFNQKHKVMTMKPISFLCLLRASKSQLQENGYKNSLIDNIYQLILENAAKESHTISFPDIYVPCLIQLKAFYKNTHIATFAKKLKQLHDKISENSQFIKAERDKVVIDLSNLTEVKTWENKIKNQGTPLLTFYTSWVKFYQSQQMKLLTNNDEVGDYKFLKKRKRGKDEDEHDSDLDMPVEEMEKLLKKQADKKQKKKKAKSNSESVVDDQKDDVVEDMTLADWI